jgi:IS30 family transposase
MPAVRVKLMLSDREEISRGPAEGLQYKEIGLRLGRDSSVISRDVARRGGRTGYRAAAADTAACAARERPKLFAVERSLRLRAVVCAQLRDGWSPASIAGRLPVEYASDQACRVSHEAIYQWVYAQPVSTLARELISLRTAAMPAAAGGVRRRRRGSASPATSTSAPPRSGAGPCLATGRETWSSARTARPRSRRWSSGPPGSSSWCPWPGATR